jgi:signal transduction histidine kinase
VRGLRAVFALRTVRARITLLAMVVAAVVLAGTSVALVVMQRRVVTASIDETLSDHADAIERVAGALPPGSVLPDVGEEEAVAQVVTLGGEVVAASSNLAGASAVAPAPTGDKSYREIEPIPPDDAEQRLHSRRITTADGRQLVIHVAKPLDDLQEGVRVLVASLGTIIPVVVVVLGLAVWRLVGRTLHPVEQIRAQVAAIGGTQLDRRVPQPPGHDEIARLASTMNEMLERIERATRLQQQFVADASHELRTPLTRMRAEIEVDLAHPETADQTASMTSILEEVEVLQRLVDQLLFLARADAGHAPEPAGPVDLGRLVRRESEAVRGVATGSVDVTGVDDAQVLGEAEQLGRIVRNLLDNAARHARSRIMVTLSERDGRVELAVADDGPGIPPAERERIFERFTRLDEARSANAGGAGLGLAIARELTERHGGTIAVDPHHGDGARFVVSLPAARRPAEPPRALSR